jgi:predicted enzyme related to lactoylglutathione lyase
MPGQPGPPRVFRVLLPARDLGAARRFYERLLGVGGRDVGGGRIYFDCGPVIVGILDISEHSSDEHPGPAEALYLSVDRIQPVHDRARELGCLSKELLHGDPQSPLGEIVTRPWGERSFYVVDPTGNTLCFVEAGTEYTGTPEQIARLRRS